MSPSPSPTLVLTRRTLLVLSVQVMHPHKCLMWITTKRIYTHIQIDLYSCIMLYITNCNYIWISAIYKRYRGCADGSWRISRIAVKYLSSADCMDSGSLWFILIHQFHPVVGQRCMVACDRKAKASITSLRCSDFCAEVSCRSKQLVFLSMSIWGVCWNCGRQVHARSQSSTWETQGIFCWVELVCFFCRQKPSRWIEFQGLKIYGRTLGQSTAVSTSRPHYIC